MNHPPQAHVIEMLGTQLVVLLVVGRGCGPFRRWSLLEGGGLLGMGVGVEVL